MIYTSYFANIKNLTPNIIPIAICGKSPNGWNGLEYKKLAPKYKFFMEWKENHNNEFYIQHFQNEVLDKLDFKQVLKELSDKMKSSSYYNINIHDSIALVCYEKPEDFCHRHLVADWFNSYEYNVQEFKI